MFRRLTHYKTKQNVCSEANNRLDSEEISRLLMKPKVHNRKYKRFITRNTKGSLPEIQKVHNRKYKRFI